MCSMQPEYEGHLIISSTKNFIVSFFGYFDHIEIKNHNAQFTLNELKILTKYCDIISVRGSNNDIRQNMLNMLDNLSSYDANHKAIIYKQKI